MDFEMNYWIGDSNVGSFFTPLELIGLKREKDERKNKIRLARERIGRAAAKWGSMNLPTL